MPTIHNVNFLLAFCNGLIVGTNLSPFISYAQPVVIQFFAINLSTSHRTKLVQTLIEPLFKQLVLYLNTEVTS